MKIHIGILVFLFNLSIGYSQDLYMKVKDKNDNRDYFVRHNNDGVVKSDVHDLSFKWDVICNNNIVAVGLHQIGIVNIKENSKQVLVEDIAEYIVELCYFDNSIYYVTVPFESVRYSDFKLYSLDIRTKEGHEIHLNDTLNITNLICNNQYLIFTHFSDEKYYLVMYSMKDRSIEVIDEALKVKNEYFTGADNGRLYSIQDGVLYYYKFTDEKGFVYSYDMKSMEKRKVIKYPEKYILSYSYWNKQFFFNHNGDYIYDNSGDTLFRLNTEGYIHDTFYIK